MYVIAIFDKDLTYAYSDYLGFAVCISYDLKKA